MPITDGVSGEIPERPVKQVIVMRRNLGMGRGKEIAQGSHAAMAWLTGRMEVVQFDDWTGLVFLSEAERKWVTGIFTKVTLQVATLDDLMAVHEAAEEAGLEVNLITDAGLTMFHGEPTITCLAIGPDYADLIDPVTKDLRLY